MASSLLASMALLSYYVVQFLFPSGSKKLTRKFYITTTDKIASGKSFKFKDLKGGTITVTNTGKEFIALSTKCTHLGCQVFWKKDAKVFYCPCHEAQKTDVDAWEHEGNLIAVIVSPKDCSKCHSKENEEFQASHHADAGKIIGSLDNVLAEVVEGNTGRLGLDGNSPAAINGCWQCHGSVVKIGSDGRPTPATWPNTGIGRINPDGSKGSCTACHSRHIFSLVVARQPDSCGKCHMGPDHPQKEIYEASKHGIAFKAFKEYMKLDAQPWRVGIEYTAAPTCATCHMSATQEQMVTHDVGRRIS
jgi:hypothetical protein